MSAIDTLLPGSQLHQNVGGTVRNPYDDFVSPNMTPGQTSAYQKRRFDTQNLPDGIDRSIMIRDSTEEIMYQFLQKWQLSQVLPWEMVNVLELTLQYFEALPTFFSVTPEQAVGHMLTQSETVHRVSLVRFSLQARMEWGFLTTAKGQARYRAMLNQFAVSMIETAHAEVYRALLQSHDPQQTWLMRHGEVQMDEFQNYLNWDHFVFAALQKIRDNPLEKIDAKVKTMMTRYRGQANTYILGEEMQVYAQTVPLRKTRYNLGGQEAVDRINGKLRTGGDSNTPTPLSHVDPISYVGENQVFVARSFVVEGEGDIDPFKRIRQIGEWNILQDNIRTGKYDNDRRTIFLYNQTRDVMSPITLRDCILNCYDWNADGTVQSFADLGRDVAGNPDAKYDPFVMETNSYDGIKFIGDMADGHIDVAMVKRAANSMIDAAFEGDSDRLKEVTRSIDTAMREIRGRLMGQGNNAFQVSYKEIGEEVTEVFDQVAQRLSSLAGNSAFLGDGTGRALYETIVYGSSIPLYRDAKGVGDAEEAVLLALVGLAREGTDLATKLKQYNNGAGSFDEKRKKMAEAIEENIDETKLTGRVAFNNFYEDVMRDYNSVATEGVVYFGKPAGFASPAGVQKAKEEGFKLAGDVGEAQEGVMEEKMGGFQTTESPIGENFPSNLWNIPFVSRMIASSMERLGATTETRRVLNDYDEYDLGSIADPIGIEIDQEQRRKDMGYVPRSFRALGLANFTAGQLRLRLGTMARHVENIAKSGMGLLRKIFALVYIGLPFTRDQLLALNDNNILVPVNFIVLRPNVQVETQIIIKCQSGGGAGYTYYGHSNVAVGDNVLTKTHTINYTFYLRAFVHKPRNVFIIPDVFVCGYSGGLGVGFHDPNDYDVSQEVTLQSPSIFCVMTDYNTRRSDLPNPFDISGHFTTGAYRSVMGQNVPAYNTNLRQQIKFGFGVSGGTSTMPVLHEVHQNTLVYRGHTEEDDGTGRIVVRPNTGHHGPDVYVGCKRVREGELYELRDMQYGTGRA